MRYYYPHTVSHLVHYRPHSRILNTDINMNGYHRADAPPTGQPASSLGGPPTTSTTPPNAISGTLLIVGIAAGTSLVLINILIIGCCLHKRNTKQIKRGKWSLCTSTQEELLMNAPNKKKRACKTECVGFEFDFHLFRDAHFSGCHVSAVYLR